MHENFSTFAALQTVAVDDANHARALMTANDTPFTRRIFVRTAFASIEAVLHALRLECSQEHPEVFSGQELMLLRGENWVLDSDGTPKRSEIKASLIQRIKFTFAMQAKTMRTPSLVDYHAAGWRSFKQAVKVRDRLAHPKTAEDLIVSDDEVLVVFNAEAWVMISITLNLAAEISALASELEQAQPTNRTARTTAKKAREISSAHLKNLLDQIAPLTATSSSEPQVPSTSRGSAQQAPAPDGRSVHAGCIEPAARTDREPTEGRPLAAGRNRRAPTRPGGRARVRR